MVALLSKSAIQSLNIDTIEKALVFGALALRAALVGSDNGNAADLAVSINVSAFNDTEGTLNLEVYIPYSAYQLNVSGGQLLDVVLEYSSNSSSLDTDLNLGSVPTLSDLTIPPYDDTVITTFEKYLVYYSQLLWASVANKRNSPISIMFFSSQDQPQILISAKLPFNLNQWLLGGNYLDALGVAVSEYVSLSPPSLDPALFTVSANYLFNIDYPDNYSPTEFRAFQSPTILESVYLDVYYDDIEGAFDCYFYLNGVEVPYQTFSDYGGGSFEITFDTANNPVIFMPGDTLDIEIYDDQQLSQLDANLYVLELPAPPQ